LGFLLAAHEDNLDEIHQVAEMHGLSVCRIGRVDGNRMVKLRMGTEERTMFDFTKGSVLTPKNNHY
jgi:selenophosphate synthetase-related protein